MSSSTYSPRAYQLPGIDKLYNSINRTGAALDMSDMGTGKTWKALFLAKRAGVQVAIVCPAVTKAQWIDAATKVGVKVALCESYQKCTRGTAEGVSRSGDKRKRFKLNYPRNTLWIFDEVHNCRNPKALQTQLLIDARDQEFPLLLLSATPFENTTQLKGIGHAMRWFHKSDWWNWCLINGGCRLGRFGGLEYTGGEQTMRSLRAKHEDMLDRVSIQQVADLPEFKMSTRMIAVEDTKALDLAYVELLHAYAEETEHAMVRRLRQRQIIEHEKTQGLFELASEFIDSGQKVLHFVNFRDTIENLTILHAKAKHQFGRIDGEVDGGERQESIELFQAGMLDGLIVNMQSGGVGLNLQDTVGDAPRTAILNLTDSATWFKQATGRTFRDGSKSACRFVVPLVVGTVEEQMDANLTSKFKNLEALVDGDFCP